jgi:hypothetical protein
MPVSITTLAKNIAELSREHARGHRVFDRNKLAGNHHSGRTCLNRRALRELLK